MKRHVGALVLCFPLGGVACGAESTAMGTQSPNAGTSHPAPGAPAVFVDGQIGSDSCTNYDPAGRACGGGSARAFRRFASVVGLRPGDVVAVRGGDYAETLKVASGSAGAPVTYQRYGTEVPRIRGEELDPAIELSNASYVVIDGLTVEDVVGWLRAEKTQHAIVRNSTFRRALASGSRAGLKFIRASDNKVLDNVLEDGNDDVLFIESDRNLVSGNTITDGHHALWTILCGSHNVIRANTLRNQHQKIGQVSDCEGEPSDTPVRTNATKRNLVEDNVFGLVPTAGRASVFSGIQYAAQKGIVRRNRFHDIAGSGLQMTIYDAEARFNTDNRIYHNVFFGTQFAGIEIQAGIEFSGNVFKNNILAGSVFVAQDTRWPWYTDDLAGRSVQIITARRDGYMFDSNDIVGTEPGQPYVIAYGQRDEGGPNSHDLAWWQEHQPKLFLRNLGVDPGFVNAAGRDFHLMPTSPMVDAGAFLTVARSAGSGTSLVVEDASYFYDGFGIEGERGDLIQLAGQTETARIVRLDDSSNTLTLDKALTWTTGQGVSLAYSGRGPDIGAFELSP